ncbi:unnamed protein product [Lactuca saligna]|uniref:Uncharacterized protein n=1 Tax=Lactuca saligna TaxID=75948 RepID=A0AA35YY82_LACSI|nr:unnamed protein product [Lactuca saligna]
MEDKEVLERPMGNVSSKNKSHVQSNFEDIGISSSSVKTSLVGTSTFLDDSNKISTPEKTSVIPPEVLLTKSFNEEVRTSGIPAHVSHTDANVNMGEGVSNKENPVSTNQGIF